MEVNKGVETMATDLMTGLVSDHSKYMIEAKFNPKLMADALMRDFYFFTYAETEAIYVYEDGIYKPTGINFIGKEMLRRLGTYYRKNQVAEVIDQIKKQTMIDIDQINSEKHLINLKNGLYNIKEKKFKPHDPNFLSTIRIPVDYKPDAKCPEIEKFLDAVVKSEDRQTLLEWSGLMLAPETKFEKAMMLVGTGGNGKTTFLNLLTALIGKKNTSSISLQKLTDDTNRFAVAQLYGKLMNSCADIPSTKIHDSAMFKLLVGKDLITAEKKYEHAFDFYNTARLIFSTKTAPNPDDITDRAYFRRWLMVEFPFTFSGTPDDDKDLETSLTTDVELSGFLSLALDGLKTILKNGKFTYELSIEDTADLYKQKSNPVYKFAKECIVSSQADTLKIDVYVAYLVWCERNNEENPLENNIFGKKFKALGYESFQKGDRKWYHESITIKTSNGKGNKK